jgi:hypothetical protein
MNYSQTKRSINADVMIDRFKKHRIKLSKSDAEKYIDLLYFLAGQVVEQAITVDKKRLLFIPDPSRTDDSTIIYNLFTKFTF